MPYDSLGEQSSFGTYSSKFEAEQAARGRAAWMHEQAAQHTAQLAAEPKPALAVMIAVAGVAIVGNAIATALRISFDNAIWLMIGMLVLVGFVAARIAQRQRALREAEARDIEAQALGFSSRAGYDAAVLARRARLGVQLNDELVQEMLLVNLRTTGRSNVDSTVEFESAMEWMGQQRGVDVSLAGRDWVPPTLREALLKQLRASRVQLFVKTVAVFGVLAAGSLALFAGSRLVSSLVGVVITSPLWVSWAGFGAALAFAHGVLSLLLGALDDVVQLLQRAAAYALDSAGSKLASSRAGIRVSALPEALAKWKRETLGQVSEASTLGRIAGVAGSWMLNVIQKRAVRQLGLEAKKRGTETLSLFDVSSTLSSIALTAVTGPLKRQLGILRWLSGAGLFCVFLATVIALWGASLWRGQGSVGM